MIVLIDNYDSFTWNLVQYFGDLGRKVEVHRNDRITVVDVLAKKPEAVVISPGPGTPDDSGICPELIAAADVPVLGICLGHQAIGQVFGGKVTRGPEPVHGKVHHITHTGKGLFSGVINPCPVTRYHSLIVEKSGLPECLAIDAESEDGIIMALHHKDRPVYGVQFHPESIATENGHKMLANFLDLADNFTGAG